MYSTFTFLLIFCFIFTNVNSLCSSNEYSSKIKKILSLQSEYDIYEGDYVFLARASGPVGTNPSGIYGTTSFNNIEINDPYSVSPNYTYFSRS